MGTLASAPKEANSVPWCCKLCKHPNLNDSFSIVCKGCGAGDKSIRESVLGSVRRMLSKHKQEHLLDYCDQLSDEKLNQYLSQIMSIDFDLVTRLYNECVRKKSKYDVVTKDETNFDEKKQADTIKPFPLSMQFGIDKSEHESKEPATLAKIGYKAIAQGNCGIIILAGGQGTRLKWEGPKGTASIELPSKKSIFQLHFEKAIKVKQLAAENSKNKSIYLPIYIMTSPNTDKKTRAYLSNNEYFGYDKDEVRIFTQGVYPCIKCVKNGYKIIMSSKDKIAMSPNGNGGIYHAIEKHGILQDLLKNNVKYVQVFGIDNVLAKIGDPVWFGHCFKENIDISNKICQKQFWNEKVGVMCLRNGLPSVIEYSEITESMAKSTYKNGKNKNQLAYGCANLAMHTFSVDFLQRIIRMGDKSSDKSVGINIPIHVANKRISYFDKEAGKTIDKDELDTPNGIKLEYFIFDTFKFSKKMTTFAILRDNEFSPVKNFDGPCSPSTARQDISRFWQNKIKEITKGDVVIQDNEQGNGVLEVSSLLSYDGEGQRLYNQVKGKVLKLPLFLE